MSLQPELNNGPTFEELTAQALIDQGMRLTHEIRSTWIREKFCTEAELGRIAFIVNNHIQEGKNG